MQGIQASAYFHFLNLVHCFTFRKQDSAILQTRPSIWKAVLNHKVSCLLRVDKGRRIRISRRDGSAAFLHAVLLQNISHGIIRSGRNLVNHAPWKGNLSGINIFRKSRICLFVFRPCLREGQDSRVQPVPIVGAVVCADHCSRFFACTKPRMEQRCHLAHIACRFFRAIGKISHHLRQIFPFCVRQAVSLFRNRKSRHLKGIICKDAF